MKSPEFIRRLHEIVGEAGIVDDADRMREYLVDERELFHGSAAVVVKPSTNVELSQVMRICFDAKIEMVPQGGNTGYCGGATPDSSGSQVLINLSRLNRMRAIDARAMTLTADAGLVLADAQAHAAEQGLLLPLAMGSQASCQLGGNLSTNAGGLAVLRYGTARELTAGLEVVLPNGDMLSDLAGLRKDNTGYDLKQLFIGAEGSLGIISGVCLRLFPRPHSNLCAWLGLRHIDDALDLLNAARAALGDRITSMEFIAHDAIDLVSANNPESKNPLAGHEGDFGLMEIACFGDGQEVAAAIEAVFESAIARGNLGDAVIAQNESQRLALWRMRESIPAAERLAGGSVKHDISVPMGELCAFAERCRSSLAKNFPDARLILYGHVGDGNLHCNVLAPNGQSAEDFRAEHASAISTLVHELARDFAGSVSAEHGIGQLKRDLLAATTSPVAMGLMLAVKNAIDPHGLMNPGKVLSPH